MPKLNQNIQKLIDRYQLAELPPKTKEQPSVLHVDEVVSRVAAFYEKIRGVIDWQEENLLKRRAIERALKRRIFINSDLSKIPESKNNLAESLILELIRGGHFPNDYIEAAKAKEVASAIEKYVFIIEQSPKNPKKSKLRLINWLSSIAASEIEEILAGSFRERALIGCMFSSMKEQIQLKEAGVFSKKSLSEKEKDIQIYIAVQRALFKLDPAIISYHLLKYQHDNWSNLNENEVKEISEKIYDNWNDIEKWLGHPLGDKFYHLCERYDTPYLLLGDIAAQDPSEAEKTMSDPEQLENEVKEAYDKRLKTIKARISRAAVYATLSIFLTKILIAMALEIPLDRYITGEFNALALAVNILIPPFLMFLLVSQSRPPKKGNREQVILEVMKTVYERNKKDVYQIRLSKKRGIILDSIMTLFYLLSFLVSLGIIVLGLRALNFPILSYFIFVVFVSLIAFAGTKIRRRAKELEMVERKEPFLHIIFDPFSIPLVQLGKWLTTRWQRYNVLASFFNVMIDAPFLLFVEFLEQWRYFLKEKKEEIH